MLPLVSLLVLTLAPQTAQTRRESWPDGSPRAEYQVERDRSGKELRSGHYRSWHENGALASDGVFAQDRETGKWRFFHPNGQPEAEGSFARGERTGAWETFHASSQRASKGRYDKGRRTGEWNFFREDGARDSLNSGHYELVSVRADDGRTAEGYRLDGAPHGPWSSTWPDGTPQLAGELVHGAREGDWLFHHPDGSFSSLLSGRYEHGRRTGPALLVPQEAPASGPASPPEAGPGGWPAGSSALEAELEAWIAADAKQLAALRAGPRAPGWIEIGLRALPVVLRRLQACDPESPVGRAAIGRLDEVALQPLCGGRPPAALPPGGPQDAAAAREFVRAWISLWAATRGETWFWTLEVPFAPLESPDRLLAEPPLLLTRAIAPAASPPPPLYERRFAPRGKGPTTAALEAALHWLVQNQEADGRWSASLSSPGPIPAERLRVYDPGITALALLSLLGAARTPRDSDAVSRGVAWLLDHQDGEGRIQNGRHHDWIYGHAMATLALCEAQECAPELSLRPRVQAAVDLLLAARNPEGAWRYDLPPSGDNDTSVTAWAVTALFSAREAGYSGDFQAAFDGALAWIDLVTETVTGRVGYDSVRSLSARTPVNERFPRERGEAMTGAGLLCRRLLGQTVETHPILEKHLELLRARPPVWDPEGLAVDEYYFYYGAQALALCGESGAWDKGLKEIANAQSGNADERGSWDPVGAWACFGGRVFSTALLALALEAPFRYALPEGEGGKKKRK